MATTIHPLYSRNVKTISLEIEDNKIIFLLKDSWCEELTEFQFDQDYFKRHFRIVSERGNMVTLKPVLYSNHDSKLTIRYKESDDNLEFDYGPFDFELDKEEAKALFGILLD